MLSRFLCVSSFWLNSQIKALEHRLPCSVLRCPSLSCWSYPFMSLTALFCLPLLCPILSSPVLSCPVYPCRALLCPASPVPCRVLSCLHLPFIHFPYLFSVRTCSTLLCFACVCFASPVLLSYVLPDSVLLVISLPFFPSCCCPPRPARTLSRPFVLPFRSFPELPTTPCPALPCPSKLYIYLTHPNIASYQSYLPFCNIQSYGASSNFTYCLTLTLPRTNLTAP